MNRKTAPFLLLPLLLCALLAGCIKNDIPYPRIQANFTSISASGQSRDALIDSASRIVTLYLPEEANIFDVKIDSYTLTPKSEIVSGDITGGIDLSADYPVTLRLYQDYLWKIRGEQDIERYFSVANQVGSSVIDVPGRRVVATVTDKTNIASLEVTACKLGPAGASYTPDIAGQRVDFRKPVVINIEFHGHIERWTIYIEKTTSSVTTARVDAWTCVAWVYGEAEAGKANTVQYRLDGDDEWIDVPDSWVSHSGGSFCGRLTGLSPLTTYEARAVSDNEYGEIIKFTTGAALQLPNSDFDSWWLDGKVWNPWPENGEQYWDTGNKGATTLGPSNTQPTDDTPTGTGLAARLETKFVGIGMLGKLAAGNLFAGKYVRTDGTNGILDFGHPFTDRPTGLSGYMKYTTAPISSVTTGFENLKGRPDTCIIWCALIDADSPFQIRTNPKDRNLFDPEADNVIAYGKYETGTDVPAYVPFHFDLVYKDTQRAPKYILVTCSASKYGDYFTGGNGAILFIDDFKLTYDY